MSLPLTSNRRRSRGCTTASVRSIPRCDSSGGTLKEDAGGDEGSVVPKAEKDDDGAEEDDLSEERVTDDREIADEMRFLLDDGDVERDDISEERLTEDREIGEELKSLLDDGGVERRLAMIF
jgi:hypothetical protein